MNSSLNLALIPSLGAKGSCFAALASQGFCGIMTLLYVWTKLKVTIHLRSLIIYIFTGGILSGFLYLGKKSGINPLWLLAGVALISLLSLIASGLKQIWPWLESFKKTEFK